MRCRKDACWEAMPTFIQCFQAKVSGQTLKHLFRSARAAQSVTPQSDVELVTENQVLSLKLASRLEHVGDERRTL